MAEEQTTSGEGNIEVQKVFIKDISFESPNSPQIFTEQWQPQVEQQMNHQARKVGDNVYEAVLTATLTVRNKESENIAYLVEVKMAGIFNIVGGHKDWFDQILGIYCPNLLFPYIREAISDLVVRGGFPQLILPHMNFREVFVQHQQALANASGGGEAAH